MKQYFIVVKFPDTSLKLRISQKTYRKLKEEDLSDGFEFFDVDGNFITISPAFIYCSLAIRDGNTKLVDNNQPVISKDNESAVKPKSKNKKVQDDAVIDENVDKNKVKAKVIFEDATEDDDLEEDESEDDIRL